MKVFVFQFFVSPGRFSIPNKRANDNLTLTENSLHFVYLFGQFLRNLFTRKTKHEHKAETMEMNEGEIHQIVRQI